jgi:hypothetical protein
VSFSFSAIGTRDEVARQLKKVPLTVGENRFNEFGADLRDLLVKHFEAETASAGPGYEYRYAVRASGHGGGNVALCLDLKVDTHWVPADEPETAESASQ